MTFIYDLDNEYGGVILADSGTTTPALSVNNNGTGLGLAITSTISGTPMRVDSLGLPAQFRSTVSAAPAVLISRTVNSVQSVAALRFAGTSVASAAIMEFQGGFISCTSILVASAAHVDYVIPVQVGVETRYIPVWKATGVVGAAAFA